MTDRHKIYRIEHDTKMMSSLVKWLSCWSMNNSIKNKSTTLHRNCGSIISKIQIESDTKLPPLEFRDPFPDLFI